jgi:hypothetical protein
MRVWTAILAAWVGVLFSAPFAFAASSEMEILLKKLQEKGILSAQEAAEIAKETKEAADAQKAEVKEAAAKTAAETVKKEQASAKALELPDWVRNTKLKGDLRLRYEAKDREDDARGTQGRARIRLRAGVDSTITDTITAGFGLASGTGDERSANQTFGNVFTRKSIWLDYAYAKYTPAKWFSVVGGKFANPIWQPADMIISSDVNPEGGAVRFEGQVTPTVGLFFNGGLFILDDRTSSSPSSADPLMYVIQPGVKWNITKDTFVRFAPAYYVYSDLHRAGALGTAAASGTGTPSTVSTNTATASGRYQFNYTAINWGGEVGFNKPFGLSAIPYLGFMGGYINNPDPSDNNTGYLAGFSIGYPNVANWGDWAVEYTYRRIEKDSILDLFPDSSFYSGNTNVAGHRLKFLFGLTKNVALGINLYDTWKLRNFSPTSSLTIPGATRKLSAEEYLGQADLILKW